MYFSKKYNFKKWFLKKKCNFGKNLYLFKFFGKTWGYLNKNIISLENTISKKDIPFKINIVNILLIAFSTEVQKPIKIADES